MRVSLPSLALLLAGCPEPVAELPPSAAGVGEVAPAPAGEAAGEGIAAEGDAQPAAPSGPPSPDPGAVAAPPEGGTTGGPPIGSPEGAEGPPPFSAAAPAPGVDFAEVRKRTLASLAKGGATVTIRGTLDGATKAQVDFTAVQEVDGKKAPEILQIVDVTDGTFTVTAPATYDRPIWVSATSDTTGDGITPDDPGGVATAPIQLAGKDVSVTITVATGTKWGEKLPWYVAGAPPAGPVGAGGKAP